ncbi:MAG: Pycsar system effector family protein [Ferruginibacter sp.]
MSSNNIYKKTEQFVKLLYGEKHNVKNVYHNISHTRDVVARAQEIAGHYELGESDMMVLFIACWFHDTGYLSGPAPGHENRSVEIMSSFAKANDISTDDIKAIEGCILATTPGTDPVTIVEKIICDADTYHLGTKEFKKNNNKVYEELMLSETPPLSKKDFQFSTLEMFNNHNYFTEYCQDLLNKKKQKNFKWLEQKLENYKFHKGPEITEQEGTRKGIQTLLRLTSSNHIQLSDMADSKANILISVNAIIISVILSVLLRKLQTDPYLTIPTAIFLVSAVITIIISILATRPKVTSGTFEDDDVVNKKTNLLFFGNFYKVPADKYERAMRTMMKDSDYLYSSIVQDIYQLGIVLGKKYRLIRLAYTIFMIGIIASVLSFGVATYFNSSAPPPETTIINSSGSPF